MTRILLFTGIIFTFHSFAQVVTYDIPISSTVGLELTSGDICTAPFTTEEAKQMSVGNSWGGTWVSTNAGTAVSIQVELSFTFADNQNTYPTTLNGSASNTVDSGPSVNCTQGSLLTWNIDPASYNAMGTNTFLVDYSSSSIINQLDNLPYAGDPYMRVTVTYATAGIDDLENDQSAELIKITDLMGRETELVPNTPLILYYSDGSIQRIFKMED